MASRSNVLALRAHERGLYNVTDAAAYLGISSATLYNWVSMKRIAYVKVGARTFFAKGDLDAFIARHRVEAARR